MHPTNLKKVAHFYLIVVFFLFQAKENELELKNQWSQNRMSRKQTQSKYGF
jgi:proline-rich protein PRCC